MRGGQRNGECITWVDDFGEDWTYKAAGNGRKMRKDIYKFQKIISSSFWTWEEGFKWVEDES